jgi:hypothetical protein
MKNIIDISEKALQTRLYSSHKKDELISFFNKVKEENFSTALNGYIPSKTNSIINLYNYIFQLSHEYKEIIVFAADAIGFEYYLKEISQSTQKHDLQTSVLSSVFPSTTAAAWTSVLTGSKPSYHGVYGTSFLHEQHDANYFWIANILNKREQSQALTPEESRELKLNLSKNKTIFEKVKENSFSSYFLDAYKYSSSSPLLQQITRGSHFIEAGDDYQEMAKAPEKLMTYLINKTKEVLKKDQSKKLLWNFLDYDLFIHINGYEKLTERTNWNALFDFWDEYKNKDRVFLFVADHGQLLQKDLSHHILNESIKNTDLKHNTGGAGRTVYFYPFEDTFEKTWSWVKKIVGDSGILLKKQELVDHNLIEKDAIALSRIGDIIALGQKENFPSTGYEYVHEHGSLGSEEMYVPIIIKL